MKLKSLAAIAAAALAMAAAPLLEAGDGRSAWGNFVAGVGAFVRNPFGLARRDTRQPARRQDAAAAGKRSNQLPAARPVPGRDEGVRQATALLSEPSAAADKRGKARSPKRPMWLSRQKRRSRTVSQYMAQEKP